MLEERDPRRHAALVRTQLSLVKISGPTVRRGFRPHPLLGFGPWLHRGCPPGKGSLKTQDRSQTFSSQGP
jgi:hypothetical protein